MFPWQQIIWENFSLAQIETMKWPPNKDFETLALGGI